MTYPTIYVSITDGKQHLAIDGHLDLLKRFVSTFLFNDGFQSTGGLEKGESRIERIENLSKEVEDGRG